MSQTLSQLQLPGNVSVTDYVVIMTAAAREDQRNSVNIIGKQPAIPEGLLRMRGWTKTNTTYEDKKTGFFGVVYTKGADTVLIMVKLGTLNED